MEWPLKKAERKTVNQRKYSKWRLKTSLKKAERIFFFEHLDHMLCYRKVFRLKENDTRWKLGGTQRNGVLGMDLAPDWLCRISRKGGTALESSGLPLCPRAAIWPPCRVQHAVVQTRRSRGKAWNHGLQQGLATTACEPATRWKIQNSWHKNVYAVCKLSLRVNEWI